MKDRYMIGEVAELLKNGEITKLSGGRYTAYLWSGEE